MAEGSASSLHEILGKQPQHLELMHHAKTAQWYRLGTQLELDNVKLNGCNGDLMRVYDLWIQEKAENATRRNLLDALRAIGENNVAYWYEEHLKTLVSSGAEPKMIDPNTSSVQPPYPLGNPPHSNYVPHQHYPFYPHPTNNPTVGGGGYHPNPYPQHYPPQHYQYPYPAPNPPYYQQPYANTYPSQPNPYPSQLNPYPSQPNPNPAFATQPIPHAHYLNPSTTNVPVPPPYSNTANIPTPNPSTTNVPPPQPNPSTTNVPPSQPNPNATPLPTIITAETQADFDTQVNMQYNDKRVGLVVIMGVVNKNGPQGTDIDIDRVKKTFQDLNFATWVIKDPTPCKVREAVKIVTEYDFPTNFRGVIVYYAGHGGSYNEKGFFVLPCGNNKHENFPVDSEIIDPFQPKNKNCRLSDRYRLFLFDCCLKEDANPGTIPTAQTVIEPNLNLPPHQPKVDHTLVAHAAYVREASKGKFWDGGVWTHCLCDNIKSYGSTKTIGAILTITREDVIKRTAGKVQAPFYKSMGGDVMLLQGTDPTPPAGPGPGTVPSNDSHIPTSTPPTVADPGPSDDDIDIDKIMDAIPDKSDLMTVLDGIKDDVKKWREYFGKRLLRDAKKSDPWFRNFTELAFLIDEITGDNSDYYIYTWGSVIDALDKPTPIKYGSNRAGFKCVSDVVRDHLNNRDVYDSYMDQLK